MEWGEIPTIVKKKKMASQKKQLETGGRTTIDDEQLLQLKELIDEYPQLYLDEISLYFGVKTGVYLLTCTIWRYMTNNLGYSLRVLSEVSKKRNEMEEIRFLNTLSINLQEHPERLVLIDETHKDRNAARRRRGWRKVNSDVESNEWYRHCVRYTLIAAADINGFITSACHTVDREEISAEGAAGTVDADYFLWWVENRLCPVLGNCEFGEPRSIVMMDNASTHMT